jgi:type IV fimbrial biogenesis protein FimT
MRQLVRQKRPFIGRKRPNSYPHVGHFRPLVGFGGFTLIELTITLAVAAVLLGVAAPSLSTFLATNRLTTQINDLMADINLARSEAIKRNVQTRVCAGSGTSCTAGGNWADGWLVLDVSGPTVIRAHEKLAGQNTTLTATTDSVTFSRNGFVSDLSTVTFQLCDSQLSRLRQVTVIPAGRPDVDVVEGPCP